MPIIDALLDEHFEVLRELGPSTRVVRDKRDPGAAPQVLRILDTPDPRHLELLAEVERIRDLSHPNVATIQGVGRLADGRSYFLQELVEGQDLYQWALTQSPDAIVDVFAQLLEALGSYHALGLVPGGERPFIAQIVEEKGQARLRLVDHGGLAEEGARAAPLTRPTHALAPERRVGARIDRRANLFEAGLILYELLAGSDVLDLPTRATSLSTREPTGRLAPGLPVDLATFVMVVLRPFPDERPRSVRDALERLERVCGHQLGQGAAREERLPLPAPCIGRGGELEELMAWASRVLAEEPDPQELREDARGPEPLAAIVGEPGSGRRRLVDELALRLGLEETVVLRARCSARGGPYAPFRELLRGMLENPLLRRGLQAVPARSRWALRLLLDTPGQDAPPASLEDPEASQLRLMQAIGEHFLSAARISPLLLVFDHLDQADPTTHAMLAHLARQTLVVRRRHVDARPTLQTDEVRGPGPPRLALVACSTELPAPTLRDSAACRILELKPLGGADLELLTLAARGGDGDAVAGGQPGALLQQLRVGDERQEESLLDLLAAELAALEPAAAAAFRCLAALGRPAGAELIASVQGLPVWEARGLCAQLVQRGLVEQTPGWRYALVHPQLRARCRQAEPEAFGDQVAGLAGHLGALLAVDGPGPGRLRRGVELLDLILDLPPTPERDGRVRTLGLGILERLESLCAHRPAAALCRALARCCPDERLGWGQREVENLIRADDVAGAETQVRELIADAEAAPPPALKASLWTQLCTSLLAQGREAEARKALDWAEGYLEGEESPEEALERARIALLAARLHRAAQEREDAAARCEQGLDHLRRAPKLPGAARLRTQLLGLLGQLALAGSDPTEAIQLWKAALASQEREGDLEGAAHTLHRLGRAAFAQEEREAAEVHWRGALERFQRLNELRGVAQVHSSLAQVSALQGGLAEAREHLRRALALRQTAGDREGQAAAWQNLGYVYSCAGALQEAAAAYRRALGLRIKSGDRWYAASASNNLGCVLMDLGDVAQARQFLRQALEARVELGDRSGEAASLSRLAELELRRGVFDGAQEALEQARRIRDELGDPEDLADAYQHEARLELAWGALSRAKTLAERGVKLAAKHRLLAEEAAGRELLGEVLARRGRRTTARRELQQARRLAEHSGNRRLARLASVELAALRLATGQAADARALLDSRPVPKPGSLRPLEGQLPPERHGVLRVRERLLRARIELSLEGGSVVTAARCGEEALAEARRAELGELEWRALQCLAATAELRGKHESALSLTLEAQELVERLHSAVPAARREAYLAADPLRAAALRGDSPLQALGVVAAPPEEGSSASPAHPRGSEGLLRAMVESTMPTIQPGRQGGAPAPPPVAPAPPPADGSGAVERGDFATIVRLNRLIVDEPDVPRVQQAIVEAAVSLCGAERAFLALFENTAEEVRVLAHQGFDEVERTGQRFFRRCAFKAATSGQLVLSAEARVGMQVKRQAHVVGLGLRSLLAAPVTVPDGRRGALYVDTAFQIGRFTEREVDLLDALADQCALSVGRAALESAIKHKHGIAPGISQRQFLQAKASRERQAPVAFGDPAQPSRRLVGRSRAMRAAVETLEQVAPGTASVLVVGPPGVGKGVAARALHDASGRSGKLVALDLRTLVEKHLELELFGHEAGAFPGAEEAREGLVTEAHGGTLLLEHLDEAPQAAQALLVGVLERKTVRPLGSAAERTLDLRVVATCGPEPERAVREGRLRDDLFLLAGEARIALPPLDERPEDKAPLIDALLSTWRRSGRGPLLSADARNALAQRSYPGNARELNAILAAATALAGEGPIGPDALPPERASSSPPLGEALAEFERRTIEGALLGQQGDLTATAKALGISRRALKRKLEHFGIGG